MTELYVLQKVVFWFSIAMVAQFGVVIAFGTDDKGYQKAILIVSTVWFLMLAIGKLSLMGAVQ